MLIKSALNKENLYEISLKLDEKFRRGISYSSQIVFFQCLCWTLLVVISIRKLLRKMVEDRITGRSRIRKPLFEMSLNQFLIQWDLSCVSGASFLLILQVSEFILWQDSPEFRSTFYRLNLWKIGEKLLCIHTRIKLLENLSSAYQILCSVYYLSTERPLARETSNTRICSKTDKHLTWFAVIGCS